MHGNLHVAAPGTGALRRIFRDTNRKRENRGRNPDRNQDARRSDHDETRRVGDRRSGEWAMAHGKWQKRRVRGTRQVRGTPTPYVVPYSWLQVRSHSKTMTHFEGRCRLINYKKCIFCRFFVCSKQWERAGCDPGFGIELAAMGQSAQKQTIPQHERRRYGINRLSDVQPPDSGRGK